MTEVSIHIPSIDWRRFRQSVLRSNALCGEDTERVASHFPSDLAVVYV